MIEKIYIHAKVEKELQRLQSLENTPGFAAKKAEQIIHSLARGKKPALAGKLTKNGDGRIKKCLKYDLGKGYRLICVKEKKSIYVLYTGSHDNCHTWLDKNRCLKIENFMDYLHSYNANRFSCKGSTHKEKSIPTCTASETDYDDILPEKISQRDLREIFKGLINSAST